MSKIISSEHSPFKHSYGPDIGRGKDNRVVTLEYPGTSTPETSPRSHLLPKVLGEKVVKISNEKEKGAFMSPEAAVNDAKYKRAKYEMLRKFLGDFVPATSFLVGERVNQVGQRTVKSFSVQDRVPQLTLADLTPEERNSDVLRGNMYQLVTRLQTMHQVLGRAKEIVESNGGTFIVEDSLDLGTLSKYVRDHPEDNADAFDYKQIINGFKASPNLLVDPETMDLSCVDFGSGEWSDELGLQMGVVNDIVEHDSLVQERIGQI